MSLLKNIKEDIKAANAFSLSNKIIIFLFNRGFHALLFYRIANKCYQIKIPVIPLLLTRIIQIVYAIDIDYKATLNGGIVIVHGVGLVIGSGVKIAANVIIFHGVTLGRRGIGPVISKTDGFPVIEEGCKISTGAVIIGPVVIGSKTIIGANCVITDNIPGDSICKLQRNSYDIITKAI